MTRRVAQPVKMSQAKEMVRLYMVERRSISEICKTMDRPYSTVRSVLVGRGVALRRAHVTSRPNWNRTPHAEVQRTIDLYLSGLSTRQVGKEMGLAYGSVMKRLQSAGVRLRTKSEAQQMSYKMGRPKPVPPRRRPKS